MADSELFNARTIARLSSKIKLTTKQSYNAREWIRLLESDALDEEKKNYLKFANMILQDILGYSMEKDLHFESGRVEFSFRGSPEAKTGGVCIEVKGAKTKDLFAEQSREKPEHKTPIKQTWDYMGSGNYDYGIATNYRDFVLIDRTKGYQRYHLFDIMATKNDESKLREFVAVFSKGSIIEKDFLPELYYESSIEERVFSTEFYKLYHETRLMLLREFETNAKVSRTEALHPVQLFLNRLIFMFFAQGTDKLKRRLFAESILQSLNPALVSEYSHYASDTILSLFERLDRGSKTPVEIFGFNGGLFKERMRPDLFFLDMRGESFFKDILSNSKLKKGFKLDEPSAAIVAKFKNRLNPLIKNLLILSSFDFKTEVNVNIIGHIFEQSLTDLEALQGGQEIPKRKKEGIYYTPTFVTQYICENTIIPYLSNRGAHDLDSLIEEYSENIDELETRFAALKILDMACGSGAFLLKAVDVLLEIHRRIRLVKESGGKYVAHVKGKQADTDQVWKLTKWNEEEEARQIIERNIFGVDRNEESVEITKLSLFLRIATTNRKLIDLSGNIRRGNSIISDNALADGVGFDWPNEFKDKFDVVIGNPPYIPLETMNDAEAQYYADNYDGIFRKYDTSIIFVEKALDVMKANGFLGFIMPLTWQTGDNYQTFREMLFKKLGVSVSNLINLPFDVFPDAYVDTGIAIFRKGEQPRFLAHQYDKEEEIGSIDPALVHPVDKSRILSEPNLKVFPDNETYEILDQVKQSTLGLGIFTESAQGIVTSQFTLSDSKLSENYYRFLKEGEANRYWFVPRSTAYINFGGENILHMYTQPKILIRRIVSRQNRLMAFYESSGIITNKDYNPFVIMAEFAVKWDLYYLLALLNSKLFSFLYTRKSQLALKDDFRQTTLAEIRGLPIKDIPKSEQTKLADNARLLSKLHQEHFELKDKIVRRIVENFKVKPSRKLEEIADMTFGQFKDEIESLVKRKLKLAEQDEWEPYLKENIEKLRELRNKIIVTENETDRLVYALYSIGEREKGLVESSLRGKLI